MNVFVVDVPAFFNIIFYGVLAPQALLGGSSLASPLTSKRSLLAVMLPVEYKIEHVMPDSVESKKFFHTTVFVSVTFPAREA